MESLFSPQAPHASQPFTGTMAPPHTHSDDSQLNVDTATAPTTDFALIESQKENIRPLPTGRSAATLSTLFEKDAESERVIHEGHERWKEQIAEAERRERDGEDMVDGVQDVLDVYNRYILFVTQHYTSSNQYLLPLLESTTRRFLSDARYAQDARYLKLWVMYARHVERREEVWAFLESRDVGTRHAVFYEEWAGAVEALGRRKKADDIYRLGIARKASPLERLKSRHQAFLARIMAVSGQVPEDDPSPPSTASNAMRTPGRSVLGQVGSTTGVAGATQLAPSMRLSKAANGSKMEIFADGTIKAEDDAPGEWADFGTRDGRRKENTVEAGPWKGETLPQSAARSRVAPRTPKIEVFKEMTDGDNIAVRATDEVFRFRQPPTEAELLKADPLRNYDTSSLSTAIPSLPTLPAPPAARKPPKPQKAQTAASASSSSSSAGFVQSKWECPSDGARIVNPTSRKTEQRMFDWKAVMKDGDEWSFEEVRARARGLYHKEWKDVKEWELDWHHPGSSTPKKEPPKKMPSPTVNTKLANEEVAMMFDQTIHGGKIRGSDSDSEDGSGSSEEEEPVEVAAPTPLPTRQQGPVAMLAPVGGMVPPTPTPASGHLAQNRAAIPMFQDENACAPPPSASKPVKFNVFGETPAKTPMAMGIRTPLALSASKPRAFGVLEEESPAPAPAQVDPTQSVKSRSALGSVNIFATPALAEKMPQRRALAHAILEEAEEAEEELQGGQQGEREVGPAADDDDERILQQVIEDAQHISVNDVDEEDDEEELPARRPRRFQIHEMTPITERTCEFTTHTTAQFNTMRSSALGNSSGRRTSARSEFDAGDEAFVTSDPAQIVENLSAVVEEEERPSSRPDSTTPTPDQSMFPPLDEASPQDYDRSGSIDPPFKISDGFTIHEATSHSMMLVDRTVTMTMHTARDVSPEPEPALEPEHEHEAEADTGAFVTASAEQLSGHDQQVLSNPCNPADERVVDALLAIVEPPLGALPGFKDHRGTASGRLDSLQKHARNRVRRASGTSRTSVGGEDHMTIDLAGAKYEIWDKIGEGGYGAVFLAVDVAKRAEQDAKDDDDDDEDEDEEDDCFVAIKVEKPSAVWETVVLDRIHRRVDPSVASSIIRPRSVYAFADESFLVLDFSSQGTLLDLVNKATQLSIAPSTQSGVSGVDELVAMFFTIELLKLVEGLHSTGFIHGDLKIDNCLVRLDAIPSSEGGTSAWSAQYDRNGLNGWSRKGVKLIDFGGAIDTSLFPAGEKQMFVADWKTDERDCVEMREGRTWSYQTDYWGLASVAYCLLFGKYIQTEQVEEGGAKRYRIATPLKRYWQTQLWSSLFDTLLNSTTVRPDASLPISLELAAVRAQFQVWLEDNCQKGGKNLRGMLKKVETAAMVGRRV